jgi:hypothetical protein
MKIELYGATGELQQTVKVDRNKPRCGEGYDYTVRNTVSGVEGFVEIRFKDTTWFEERGEPVFELLDRIVPEDDVIAEIDRFYPHRKPRAKFIPRQYQFKGIGKSVLRTVLHDLQLEDIRWAYCHNPEEEFYRMLLGEHFRELRTHDKEEHLLRKLTA